MGAFFPAGLLAAVDGWILDANPLHVAWHTALPDTSGSNEYSLNGAARLPTGTLTTSSDAAKATATNAAEIISAAASDAWSAITHLSFVNRASGGTFQAQDALGSAVTLAAGEKIRIAPGDLTVEFPSV